MLARIAISNVEHTDKTLLDTVIGFRGGNWNFEWFRQAGIWQQKALECTDDSEAGAYWLHAAHLYSVAAYPYIKAMSWLTRRRRWRIAPMKR